MRKPPATIPTNSHGVDPETPLRSPFDVRRRRKERYTSDPADLEDHLALLALPLAEPEHDDDGQHRGADGNRYCRDLDRLGALVDLASQFAELGFDVGPGDRRCDRLRGLLRLPAHAFFLFFAPSIQARAAMTSAPTTTMPYGAHDMLPLKCGP